MKYLKEVLSIVCVLICFWALIVVGSAYEQHVLCLRGQTDMCIEADFE